MLFGWVFLVFVVLLRCSAVGLLHWSVVMLIGFVLLGCLAVWLLRCWAVGLLC